MNIVHRARIALIRLGKVLPFIVCGLVFVSYAESLFALATNDFGLWGGNVIPNCNISWFIGKYFEYDIATLIVLLIISLAVETCYWNKLAILYLAVQLWEKSYISQVELYEEYIYAIIAVNLIVSGYFVCKGISILTKT